MASRRGIDELLTPPSRGSFLRSAGTASPAPNAHRTDARKTIPTVTARPMPTRSTAKSRGIASADARETCCIVKLHGSRPPEYPNSEPASVNRITRPQAATRRSARVQFRRARARVRLLPAGRPMDLEDEEVWLRRWIVRLRTISRFAQNPEVELGLREFIADAEARLEVLQKQMDPFDE